MTGTIDEPVEVVPYDSRWPAQYQGERDRLRSARVAYVYGMEHFGSTAVPGLAAKSVIDILVGLWTWPATPGIRHRFAWLGYEDLDEAGVGGRIYFRRRSGQAFNVALVQYGGPRWMTAMALRDYLRASPEAACAYAVNKKRIVAEGKTRLLAYSVAKAPIVEDLIRKSLAATL
jgi:GrpB-like predicted nucleotidyltransferase (UPF0157 family)